MVYHEPNKRPWYNSPNLWFLRLFVSDEQAAIMPRTLMVAIAKFFLTGIGAGWVIEKLLPAIEEANRDIAALIRKLENDKKWLTKYARAALTALLLYKSYRFFKYLYTKWATHVKRIPDSEFPDKFFWVSDAEGKAPKGAKGVIFNKKLNRWMTQPVRTQEQGQDRAFNYNGMDLCAFIFTEFTVGWEYPLTAMFQCVAHYFGSKRWNTPAIDANLRKTFYKGVINTGMAPFIVDDPSSKYHGHAVFERVLLQFMQNSTRLFDRIVVYLDHDKWEVEKMTLEWTNFAGETEKETWGSRDLRENARPDLNLSADESLGEAAKVCIAIIADFTHGLVHMWSNGTYTVGRDKWALQPQSHNITQWMNSQAVYLSWLFIGDTQEVIGQILTHNNGCGMPFHSTGAITKLVGERSEFHQMSVNARRRIAELLHADPSQHPNIPEIDGILATTTMHSAEHYYTSMLFPKNGNIVPLRTDLSGVIMSIIAPIKYWTRRLLVRQHLDDPICKILYEEAVKVNPDFANNALSIGCAY